MLETLISLLVVIALILFILDYLGVIEIVQAFVGLILGAVWLIGKGLMYLYRRLFRASPAPPQPGPDSRPDPGPDPGPGPEPAQVSERGMARPGR